MPSPFDPRSEEDDDEEFLDVTNPQQMRKRVLSTVKKAYAAKSIEDDEYRLEFADVDYSRRPQYTLKDEKDAILKGKRLYWPLAGRMRLISKETGKVVSEDAKPKTLAHVPYLSSMGTVIHSGSQYVIANQQRLKSGIYKRIKDNGEVEAQFNVLPGSGRGFRIHLEPATGVFRMQVGQSNTKLYPWLRDMGVDDRTLQQAWGKELLNMNQAHDDKKERISLRKIAEHLGNAKDAERITANNEDPKVVMADILDRMRLDPQVTQLTMGKAYDNVTPEAILDTSAKLIQVSRGEAKPDDRDALPYQKFLSADDYFREHVEKDAGSLIRQALWKARNGGVDKVSNGFFTRQLQSVLIGAGVAAPVSEINPMEIYDMQHKITRMGEGAITSTETVSKDARNVQGTHFGFIDPIRSPESLKIGLDLRLARGVRKGRDGQLYQQMISTKTGKPVMVSSMDVAANPITFNQYMALDEPMVPAMVNGEIEYVPKEEVAYVLPSASRLFTPGTGVIPALSGAKVQRALMGARMTTQALPLMNPDEPLVQSETEEGTGIGAEEEMAGLFGARRTPASGHVVRVNADEITVRQDNGELVKYDLYNNYPLNQKTGIHNTALVKPGQRVKSGQLLAKSNFTNDLGNAALGKNVTVAYHMMGGLTHEDAIVISESAARDKFSSEQMYRTKIVDDESVKSVSKNTYIAKYPGVFTQRQLEAVDDNGVVKPGTVVKNGDPLILAVGQGVKRLRGSISKTGLKDYSDISETWTHSADGVVTDVEKTSDGWQVAVKTYTPSQVGDKLSGRYGDKGVISAILPDAEMPQRKNGEAIDVVLNPMGIISRTNPSQIVEAALGKIAKEKGTKYILPQFNSDNEWMSYTQRELKKAGLDVNEDLTDPKTGKPLPGVFVGNRYLMKLHHLAESKLNARSQGGYTMDDAPAKGGKDGAKRLGYLEVFSLISHGAVENLKDAKLTRGQRNDEYWQLYRKGVNPPPPKVNSMYQKFESTLKAAGVHLRKQGTRTQVLPMTDAQVKEMAENRKITVADTVDFNNMEAVPGGLFDIGATGGANGTKWAAIDLAEPLPNPIMETPIRAMLGITEKEFQAVLAGEKELNGLTGGKAIQTALKLLNVDKGIEAAKADIASGRKSKRDAAVKRLKTFSSLKKMGIKPEELVLTVAPVLPPKFRSLAKMGGTELVADANYLYKDLLEANNNVNMHRKTFGTAGATGANLYNAFKAVTGLGDPVTTETQDREVKGLLKQVFGDSPKLGMYQRKVIGSSVDQVGRSVIIPDPELDVDEVGLPANAAWDLYKQYIIRDLVRQGMPATSAFKSWTDRDQTAMHVMDNIIENRPLIINRAPSLHKSNMTAHKVKLVAGDALRLPIAILSGHGADFDGDAMNFHVPHSEKAVNEAREKMMPSKMLIDPRSYGPALLPPQGYVTGLYLASTLKSDKTPKAFTTKQEAIAAYKRGDIDVDDEVIILKKG